AGVVMSKTITGAVMTVKTKVQFFTAQAAGKDYRLSLFVVEDKVVADQNSMAGTIKNCIHRNLLRTISNNNDYKGYPLNINAAIAADQTFEKSYNINLPGTWNTANLKVIGVIYDCTAPGKPVVVNTSMLWQ
ncbi:MAG: Omp28-related outer membrane protein, partial [Bacteroidia bacterium]